MRRPLPVNVQKAVRGLAVSLWRARTGCRFASALGRGSRLNSKPLTLTLLIAIFGAGPAFAQRELTKIPDPDPEIERRSFQVADGFEVNLFAADPLLAKPIQMNFDADGRLWVATSEVYPQIKRGQKANDKILVISDTQGVGKGDKISVFGDGLMIATGIAA